MKMISLIAAVLLSAAAWAVEPNERLSDPLLEARAREVSLALRCVVCQNQTIDDSDAELAHDMRVLVRERIKAGDSNEQVLTYMVQRYGDFVLLKPRMTGETYVLWFGPFLVLLIGAVVLVRRFKKSPVASASAPPLSAEEARELQSAMGKDGSV